MSPLRVSVATNQSHLSDPSFVIKILLLSAKNLTLIPQKDYSDLGLPTIDFSANLGLEIVIYLD